MCFVHYLCVVIILFNMGLFMSATSAFSFRKIDFPLFVFSIVPCLFCILNFDVISITLYNSSVMRQKGESQNGCFKKTKHAKFSEEIFVFRKIWHALFSWNTRFEIRPFALLPTNFNINHCLRIQWGLIFGNVKRCSTLRLWVGYFIEFKFAPELF